MATSKESFAQRLMGWFSWGEDFGFSSDKHKPDSPTLVMTETAKVASSSSPIGEIGRRYESVRTLGKGAYGTVTLAKDRRIGRLIAIKRLNSDCRTDTTVYTHFLQEARIAGQLENSNIVTIYDVLDDEDSPSILMEYLGGGNLEKLIRSSAPLSEVRALRLLKAIMMGLKDAHDIGVVHRDIKPSNILFDQNRTPKISDFGVALMPDDLGGVDDETARKTFVVGTPDYMSPEQLQPHKRTVDHRADFYACGLMLFEMLTGKRHQTFNKHTEHKELVKAINHLSLPEDKEFPTTVSADTRQLVRSLIRLKPAQRPDSADKIIRMIDRIISKNTGLEDVKSVEREEHGVRMEMFADILRLFLVDGVISSAERRELTVRSSRLGILPDEAIELEDMVRMERNLPSVKQLQRYAMEAESLLIDRDLSDEDRHILDELGRSLNISDAEQRKIEENIMVKFQMKEGLVEDLIP